MVESDLETIAPAPGAAAPAVAGLQRVRERTLALVGHLDRGQLTRVHSPIMSPLVWDLAHIAAYEDLWLVHRHAGRELMRPELAAAYDAFETPRALRGEIELLDADQTFDYMRDVRERTLAAIESHGVGDGFLHELVLRHELQHTETMLQTMAIAGLLPERLPDAGRAIPARYAPECEPTGAGQAPAGDASAGDGPASDPSDGEWVELAPGEFPMGAEAGCFAYDNELPRHPVRLAGFRIARRPLSNREWRRFAADGGYERREWWTEEGWAWRQQADPVRHRHAGRGDAQEPVCHICLHEAEAIARSRGARLPSEAEWERAARDQGQPLTGRGRVWEWTASELTGYPGFVAHPYREYSEVFFARGYRVLRGGSWATHPRVAAATFRNWDLPQRRQIFAGVRLAMDL